jgi:hypothetical protein
LFHLPGRKRFVGCERHARIEAEKGNVLGVFPDAHVVELDPRNRRYTNNPITVLSSVLNGNYSLNIQEPSDDAAVTAEDLANEASRKASQASRAADLLKDPLIL